MIILNYFDLGLAKDSTMIDNIINLCNNNIKLNIYAFEATYDFYFYNKDVFNNMVVHERDYLFDYFGFKTLERSYLFKINNFSRNSSSVDLKLNS